MTSAVIVSAVRTAVGKAPNGALRGILMWAMGLTHHAHGVDNVSALANLALARGWLGRPWAGLLPLRGHSNVQGVGSVGVAPALRGVFAAAIEAAYDVQMPREPGQDTYASMEAAARGEIDAAVLLGKPYVWGSIYRFDGQASVFWSEHGPCYRCLYPEPPPPGMVPSCAEGGVLGVLCATIGSIAHGSGTLYCSKERRF